MIGAFLDSWSLFGETYLAGWLIAVSLSLIGVWVVARDQIFLGAAVAQASTLGTAVALWLSGTLLGHSLSGELAVVPLAMLASIATALATTRRSRAGAESAEAVTGWIFLVGASAPVLLLAHSAHGLEEVHRLVLSSILGASQRDVVLFAALALGTVLATAALGPRLVLQAIDPAMAEAVGMRERRWRWGTAVWLGAAVGLSIHTAGTIYAFGCLVLPALAARRLCREVRFMWWVSPALALAACVPSFVIANELDVPPAQLAVAVLAGLVVVAWSAEWLRKRAGKR